MLDGEVNRHPIQLLVNYWETRPSANAAANAPVTTRNSAKGQKRSALAERLDQLVRHGVTHISTFVPWQAVESDISHSLSRFLQAVADRKMSVSLILTPEVGVHYPSSGLPKDVLSRKDDMALHCDNGTVSVNLPPNAFCLPSLFAPEFNKRYYSFLSRMDGLFADIARNQPGVMDRVKIILSGSYWKYYRSARGSSDSAFAGQAGDYSGAAAIAFRQRVDQYFAQREFSDQGPIAANRWKSRAFDESNRQWFYQQSEDVFRARTYQLLRKKAPSVPASEIELFTPEADPGFSYSHFLQMVSGGHADAARLSTLVEEAAARASVASAAFSKPYIHWSSLGGFRSLSDSEKQFLILKSLLLMGGQGGGIFLDDADWFSLSQSFRARAEGIARLIVQGDLKLKNRALYLTPHLWSSESVLWQALFRQVESGARMVSSIEYVMQERDATLLIVDPGFMLTREAIQKLTAWARAGRVVLLPRSTLYSDPARQELENCVSQSKRMEISLGIPYTLHPLGDGTLIVYDLPEESAEIKNKWHSLLAAALSLAEIEAYCRISDSRVFLVPLHKRDGNLGLFVMNETRRQVAADIIFQRSVEVSDLASSFAAIGNPPTEARGAASMANRFTLEIAPCGVLSLAIEGNFGPSREANDFFAGAVVEDKGAELDPLDASVADITAALARRLPEESSETGEGLWN